MRIIKTAIGNETEAFIEDRFKKGLNIFYSVSNNRGKTVLFQGLMYALGNSGIFPNGFNANLYYFYTKLEVNGIIYEFLRKNNTFAVKQKENVSFYNSESELREFIHNNVFTIPTIQKNNISIKTPLSLFYELFFIGQDKRNSSNIMNHDFCNKKDFENMIFSLSNCLTVVEDLEKINDLKKNKKVCEARIETFSKRLTLYKEHPEIAKKVSNSVSRKILEEQRQEFNKLSDGISEIERKENRINNRITKLRNLLTDLNSLNKEMEYGRIQCADCGSKNITFVCNDLTFDLTNEIVRRNLLKSIRDKIDNFNKELKNLEDSKKTLQDQLRNKTINDDKENKLDITDLLIYSEQIRDLSEDEGELNNLYNERTTIIQNIEFEERLQEQNKENQKTVKQKILEEMNCLYNEIDPKGAQIFTDLFTKNNITYSGSDEQEYYFCRTLALYKILNYQFPIIMDSFRNGELSSAKENIMLKKYQEITNQVIISSTLKEEEYISGTKYSNMTNVNAISYEENPDSHMLQEKYSKQFMEIVNSFGIIK